MPADAARPGRARAMPAAQSDGPRAGRLADYRILDTPPEPEFDAVTRLTAILLDVPIALISLVDAERDWFKSAHGTSSTEVPYDISFCGQIVAARVALVVDDALLDPRFATNPLVIGAPFVRFYAGMPLTGTDGTVLGTLCAVDHRPRVLTDAQLDALRLLADQVSALLELRRSGLALRAERHALTEHESELADRERRLQTVFDGMVEGVTLQDHTGAVIHHNRAAEQILGLSHDELRGKCAPDPRWYLTRPDGSRLAPGQDPGMTTLRTATPQSDVELCVHKVGGRERWLLVNARPLIAPGEPSPYQVIATFRDVTEQRAIAARLGQHQRLVTTGTLAAGVGHEINNPLTYVLTNLELAIEELDALTDGYPSRRLSDVTGMLREAREGGERVKRIVRGLKALAHDDTPVVATDINGVVHNALQLASHELRTQVTVVLELAETVYARVDPARLAQVLINLLVNAAQAFAAPDPSRNRITLRTRIEQRVIIELSDNGPGIAADVLPRIFDPFFTTRVPGTGTGLGLAISHGIVSALAGELTCESDTGAGATFRIALPAVGAPTGKPEAIARPSQGRLLVVDDEVTILKTVSRLFRQELDVVAIDDPRTALRRIEAGEWFDVVLCDLTMPYLSGMQLHAAVAASVPQLAARFVFLSGDLTRDDIRVFLDGVPNERFEKPFDVQELRGIVRRFMRGESPSIIMR